MPGNTDTATQNPFRKLWHLGDTLTYLDLDMVVVAITDGSSCCMTAEHLNTHDEIQTKVFYEHHLPALKHFLYKD